MRLFISLFLLALITASTGVAQPVNKPALGINLNGPADWNSELPFVDVFRLSRHWISQREGAGWGQGPELQLDENGWVMSLEENCFAETLLCTIDGGNYPSGIYTVLYDGEGEIRMNNARVVERHPGRLLVEVDSSRGAFFLQIRRTNPQNHIRNIRVIMPGFADIYTEEPFHPVFLRRWQGITSFRYMDWMHTNNSRIVNWSDRPTMERATWTGEGGIPLEVMIDHANRTGANPWFCMPHLANDDYVRNFAIMVRDRLNPELKVYVEYSNEVWNSMFEQHRHAQRRARELNMGPPERPWEGAAMYYVQRSQEIFRIWEEVFGGSERLVRTLAWQAASGEYWLDGMIMARAEPGRVDALSIAPYISMNLSPQSKPSSDEVANWTVEQIMDHVENTALPESIGWINTAAAVARKYGVLLTSYEAGQHLVGVGGGENNDALTKLLHQANAHPRMGEVYRKYFAAWEAADGDLLAHFSSVGLWSKWGSWGLVQHYDQGPNDSPKLKATLDWAKSLGQNVVLEQPQVD